MKARTWPTLVILLIGCTLPVTMTLAESPDPDPRDLLQKAGQAAEGAMHISYDYTYEGTGSLAGTFAGKVKLMKGGPPQLFASLAGRSSAGDEDAAVDMMIASEGRNLRLIDNARRTFSHGTMQNASHLMSYAYYAVLFQFLQGNPFAAELSGTIQYEGLETVNGVPCHVVRAQNNSYGSADVWWYLGKADLLPRAQRWKVTTPGVEGGFHFKIASLDVRSRIDAGEFALQAPAGYASIDEDARNVAVGHPAPDWSLRSASGKEISLSSLRGRVVVLDFWASWCPPCWTLMPAFDKLARHYEGRPVSFIGINSWEAPDVDPADYMREKKVSYETLLRGESIAFDYRIGSLPALFVIDPRGVLVLAQAPVSGSVDDLVGNLRAAIDEALGQ